tara:strand:+ start:6575 stop:7798 length:1224 start_codon:yes stop_codon:yes gene_type:complete
MRLTYLVKRPMTERDYHRLGISYALEISHTVTLVDLSNALHPDLPAQKPFDIDNPHFSMRFYNRISDLGRDAASILDVDLVFCLIQSNGLARNNIAVMRMLKKVGVPYLMMAPVLYPGWHIDVAKTSLKQRIIDFIGRIRAADPINTLVTKIPPRWLGLPSAKYIVYMSLESERARNNLVSPNTVPIYSHSYDYDFFFKDHAAHNKQASQPPKDTTTAPTAVFIDQYMPFHEDYDSINAPRIDAERYYIELRSLFDKIEHDLGLNVIIAAHPRAEYKDKPDYFGGRAIVYGETTGLIEDSQLVIVHTSTMFAYALLLKKPVIVATSQQLYHRQAYEKHYYEGIAAVFGKQPVFVDVPGGPDLTHVMDVDVAEIEKYINQYMRHPNAKEGHLWETVFKEIENGSGSQI